VYYFIRITFLSSVIRVSSFVKYDPYYKNTSVKHE
jgi:hypothetical protein